MQNKVKDIHSAPLKMWKSAIWGWSDQCLLLFEIWIEAENLITSILFDSIFRATCEIPYKFCQEKDFEVLNNFHFEFPFELNSVNT